MPVVSRCFRMFFASRSEVSGCPCRLIGIVGQWLMNCFDGRPVNDERFKWAMPTTVHAHVQLGFASANDSACLTAKGLELAASAAALGPIRDVAETFARLSWLLESADDRQ
jgi:hypothetical protein